MPKPPETPAVIAQRCARDLRSVAGELDLFAQATGSGIMPPEQLPDVIRNIANEVKTALVKFYGPDEFRRLNRLYHG